MDEMTLPAGDENAGDPADIAAASSDAANAVPGPQDVLQDAPAGARPEPEEETDEQWRLRFIEENQHLLPRRPERPPAPPPSPWDGPRSTWKVPDHLSMRHPKGGYMAMALMSRTMDDLDEITKGARAATYEEVDTYLGHALIAEGLVPFTYTADEAIRWWKSGGYKVLGGALTAQHGSSPQSNPIAGMPLADVPDFGTTPEESNESRVYSSEQGQTPSLPMPEEDDMRSGRADGASYDLNLAGIDDATDTRDPGNPILRTDMSPSQSAVPSDRSDLGFVASTRMPSLPGHASARQQPAAAKAGKPNKTRKPEKRPPALPGTNLSTYDAGFGGLGRGINGDYRTTEEERAWLPELERLAGPDVVYPDGLPGNEQTSSKIRREIRELVGYLYTLPEVKALLDVFSRTEETEGDGYERTHYPNKDKLPDLSTFHGSVPIGRYQITRKNWKNLGGNLWSRKDFSPTTQDLIAITQLVQTKAIDQLLDGNLSGAFSIAARIFASIPMSSEKDYSYYSGGKGKPDAGPVTNPPRQPTPVRFNDLPALFVQHLNARKMEFHEAELAWKAQKVIPQAFISPLRWRSFGLKGF